MRSAFKIFASALALAAVSAGGAIAADVVVSSKIDTEGALLGNVIAQTLRANGIGVSDRISLGTTPILRKALIAGEVDIYPEYTGNAGFFFNKADDAAWKDAAKGYALAKSLDYDANKVVWLEPAPANNTWAIGVRGDVASGNKIASMSDFGKWVSGGGKIKLAASSEFVNSAAALPAFQKTYGFTFKPEQILNLSGGDTSATIKAAADQTDGVNAAMVYGTDGGIAAAELVVLTDDKGVQPVYEPTPIIREAVLKANPKIAEVLKPIFASLDLKTLQGLNARIQVNGEASADVAKDYLKTKGFREVTSGVGDAQPLRAAAPNALAPSGRLAAGLTSRLDRVGVVIGAVAAFALYLQPFVTFRPNRIASGKGVGILAALPMPLGALTLVLLSAAILIAVWRTPIGARAVAAALALLIIVLAVGLTPSQLIPAGNAFARIAPASGFWLLALAFALLATDTLAKLSPGPWIRLAVLAGVAALIAALLSSGWWSGLSVMKEYASHADTFWREAAKHVELAFGSLVAAVIVGVPLGIACARAPALRAVTLPVLNVVQTIPSIAMYGLMLVPLGLLAARFPVLSDLGIRGIGTAPAVIALFLYSLLPVVANTVIGFDQVPAQAVDAARGMGMSGRQRLFQVELPLAAPIILTGIRIVLVQNIGLVTVAALIGGGGLGSFVFQGIGQTATDLVLLGAVPIIGLAFAAAVILDAAVELTQRRPA